MEIKKEDCAWFFSSKDQFFELSNMAGQMPIKVNGLIFNSTEALYQACKYDSKTICLPSDAKRGIDPNVFNRILFSKNAMGSKMTQKCAVKAGLVRSDWEDIKVDVMRWVLELKLQQHPYTFGKVLRSTGDKLIVERSRKDTFWGCILDEEKQIFCGDNNLGLLLTDLRGRMDKVLAGELTHPEGFLLLK